MWCIYSDTIQPTKAHGQWHACRNFYGTTLLSITFTWTGDDQATKLRSHLLQQLMPGLYRSVNNQQVYYVPAEFEKDAPVHREGLEPFNLDDEKASNVKHFFLELHPGKSLDFLSLLQNGTV